MTKTTSSRALQAPTTYRPDQPVLDSRSLVGALVSSVPDLGRVLSASAGEYGTRVGTPKETLQHKGKEANRAAQRRPLDQPWSPNPNVKTINPRPSRVEGAQRAWSCSQRNRVPRDPSGNRLERHECAYSSISIAMTTSCTPNEYPCSLLTLDRHA